MDRYPIYQGYIFSEYRRYTVSLEQLIINFYSASRDKL